MKTKLLFLGPGLVDASSEGKSDFIHLTGAVHFRLNRCERIPRHLRGGAKFLNAEQSSSLSCRMK